MQYMRILAERLMRVTTEYSNSVFDGARKGRPRSLAIGLREF